MGLLFTSADTVKLCARLNRRFSEDKIAEIRDDPNRMMKFNPTNNRSLVRIAYKSGIHPGRRPSSNVAKRWFRFLKDLDPATARQIRAALWKGLDTKVGSDYRYQSLIFVTFEGPVTKFSGPTDLPILKANGTQTGFFSLLLTLQTASIGNLTYDPEPNPDPGETAAEPDDPVPDPDLDPPSSPVVAITTKLQPKKLSPSVVAKRKSVRKKKR
jgi:hypothetical protein